MSDNEKLLAGFPPVSVAQWEAKIKEDLKGADYAKKLIRKTLDNIHIKPYYTSEDLSQLAYLNQAPGEFPFMRGNKNAGNDWEIRQDFKVTEPESVINKIQMASQRGVTSVGIDFSKKGDLYYHDFKKILGSLELPVLHLNFIAGDASVNILDYLLKALNELDINYAAFNGSLEYDPLGHLIAEGKFYTSESDDFSESSKLLDTVKNQLPYLRVLAVNSNSLCDSGASVVQELAYGLAMLSEYFVRLTAFGHNPEDIIKHLQWNLGAGSDYFMEIAKIRAARVLFSSLISAFDNEQAKEIPVYIHSITTLWNKTLYDPNVNMLRLTTEAMAAVLGGCNSLLVRPYDSSYNEPIDFSERLARNIQIILKEESYFNKVADPAAGSYYIESLTNSLIGNAWDLFLKVDEQGGFLKSFISGNIQQEIKKTTDRRTEMVASRREILLGTNQFPNSNEKTNGCIDENIAFPKLTEAGNLIANPVIPHRAAEEFEKLRLATEKYKGNTPRVFMLTYGNLAMRLARAQFSGSFFACAGYEIIDNSGFQSAQEGVDAAFKAKADIIVICSSDDEYLQIAPDVAYLVGDKAFVVVAGAPASMEELKQKGIKEFIHVRSNILETLKAFHAKLGIEL